MNRSLTWIEQAKRAMCGGKLFEAEEFLMRAHSVFYAHRHSHVRIHQLLMRLGFLQKKPLRVLAQSLPLIQAYFSAYHG